MRTKAQPHNPLGHYQKREPVRQSRWSKNGLDHMFDHSYNHFISGCSAVGSAPALGARCREFESPHSDQLRLLKKMQPLKPLLRQGFQPFQREKSSTSRDGDASKRKIEEDTSGKSKTAIFHKWQPLSAYRLGRFLPWEASFRGIAVRESFQ